MNRTHVVLLALVSALYFAACTEPTTQVPLKGPAYSQGPADGRAHGARNAPFDRSVMRDHTMPATAM